MAEALFRKYGDDILEIHSAGFEPAAVNPYAVKVMDEVGIALVGNIQRALKSFWGKMHFGYVITVCKKAEERCPVMFPGVRKLISGR